MTRETTRGQERSRLARPSWALPDCQLETGAKDLTVRLCQEQILFGSLQRRLAVQNIRIAREAGGVAVSDHAQHFLSLQDVFPRHRHLFARGDQAKVGLLDL